MPTLPEGSITVKAEPGHVAEVAMLLEVRCRINPTRHVYRMWITPGRKRGHVTLHLRAKGWHYQTYPETAWVCPLCYALKVSRFLTRKERRDHGPPPPRPW